jgi:hypothetical protein
MSGEPLSVDAANRETYRGKVELRLNGPVLVVQCDNDPGDMGEPRVFEEEDGTTVVCVPAFDLWPPDEYEEATHVAMRYGEARQMLAVSLAQVGIVEDDPQEQYALDFATTDRLLQEFYQRGYELVKVKPLR